MRISDGRIPMTAGESEQLEVLLAQHPGESATLTRRDPGETGPFVVQVGGGSFVIGEEE